MSKKRQPPINGLSPAVDEDSVRTFTIRYPDGYVIPPHAHGWHQLIYASQGVVTVRTTPGTWVVPPHRAVWVPAGIMHSIEISGPVLMQTVYLRTDLSDALPRDCSAVNVSPLLRELILRISDPDMLDCPKAVRDRLTGVLLDQVESLPTIPLQLPVPRDPRAVRVAEWLRLNPDSPGLLKHVARRAGASVRTLERLFRAETGMSFGKWRQQLRLLHALRELAAGRPVTVVALEVGYDSPSAFIAMFRSALGTTPTRYFASPAASPYSSG